MSENKNMMSGFLILAGIAALVFYLMKDGVPWNLPADQSRFIDIVSEAQTDSRRADNDLQRELIKNRRNESICSSFSDMNVSGWKGTVDQIGVTGAGKAYISIRISRNISLKTFNNFVSDAFSGTLIDPDTPLFRTIKRLETRQTVQFSGQFFEDRSNCIRELSLTRRGDLERPEFLMRFASITPK